jgi:hypothetical protein
VFLDPTCPFAPAEFAVPLVALQPAGFEVPVVPTCVG